MALANFWWFLSKNIFLPLLRIEKLKKKKKKGPKNHFLAISQKYDF